MLAARTAEPFDSSAHIFEVLWDGIRALIFVEGGQARVQDRYGRDITHRYPELQSAAARVRETGVVLDGAIVRLDAAGRPDFARLTARLTLDDPRAIEGAARSAPVTFQAFDVLYRRAQPLAGWTLRRRKEMLGTLVTPGGALSVPDFVAKDGVAFYEAAREHGLSGIIAKEWESRYLPGRTSRSWLAVRLEEHDEFVIGGFTYGGRWKARERGRREPFNSLLLGLYDDEGKLRFVGEATGGADEMNSDEAVRYLDDATAAGCPFSEEPALGRLVFWCRPEVAARVRHAGWGPDGRLRFPVFEALRPDVPPADCRLRAPG
jgi:ATP-dependent DNA ligase